MLCVLLPALIFAQWMGLAHRISHASWTNGKGSPGQIGQIQHSSQNTQNASLASFLFAGQDDSNLHSCALYDAASISDYLHLTPEAIHLSDSTSIIADSQTIISWLALLQLPFSSRAPPSLFA